MNEHPQFEYYHKRELDINNDDDRKLITDFWCAKNDDTCTANGMRVRDCKMHK